MPCGLITVTGENAATAGRNPHVTQQGKVRDNATLPATKMTGMISGIVSSSQFLTIIAGSYSRRSIHATLAT